MKNKKNNQNKFQRSFNSAAPAAKPNVVYKRGRVIEALPDAHFRIQNDDGTTQVAYLGGKMKMFKIRVLVGDVVETEADIRGGKGRVVKRV